MLGPSKEPKPQILLSEDFSKLKHSLRSVSRNSHFSQNRRLICRTSTGKKMQTFAKHARWKASPKKLFPNESKVIRSESFHHLAKPVFRVSPLSLNKTRKITNKIYKEKHQRLLIKLRSFLLLCRFLKMPPRDLLQNRQFFGLKPSPNSRAKWFFLSIKKGIPSEVKSLLKADPDLLHHRDKVIV